MLDYTRREGHLSAPFDRVRLAVSVHWYIRVEYLGQLDDLVSAGVVDARMEMLITSWRDGSKRPQGKTQTDENGDSFHVYRKPTKRQPTRNRLIRGIHCIERALALPGVHALFPEGIELQPLESKQSEPVSSVESEDPEGWKHLSLPDRIARFTDKADPHLALVVLRGRVEDAVEASGMKLRAEDHQRLYNLIAAFENDFRSLVSQSKLVPVERPPLSLVVDTRACNVSGTLSR